MASLLLRCCSGEFNFPSRHNYNTHVFQEAVIIENKKILFQLEIAVLCNVTRDGANPICVGRSLILEGPVYAKYVQFP